MSEHDHYDANERLPATRRQALKATAAAVGTGAVPRTAAVVYGDGWRLAADNRGGPT